MYLFNDSYYKEGFEANPYFEKYGYGVVTAQMKRDAILNAYDPPICDETFKSKLYEKPSKRFNKEDAEAISKLDEYLLIDIDRLIRKLDERANLDFTTNQKWIIRTMLHDYAAPDRNCRREWQTIDEMVSHLEDRRYNRKKTEKILDETEIVDERGDSRKLFNKREREIKDGKPVYEYSFDQIAMAYYITM